MGNYIKLFNSISAQTEFRNSENYIEPHVSCVEGGTNVKYNKRQEDFNLVVDYAQGENDFYAIVHSKDDIHILSKKSDGYVYIIDDNSSLLPPLQLNEGDVINVRVLNYNGETVDLQVPLLDNGEYWARFYNMIENDHVVIYVDMKDMEMTQENTMSVYISSENPFT